MSHEQGGVPDGALLAVVSTGVMGYTGGPLLGVAMGAVWLVGGGFVRVMAQLQYRREREGWAQFRRWEAEWKAMQRETTP